MNEGPSGQRSAMSFAWFPADEWRMAVSRWPDLLEERPADPLEYSHVMESHFKAMSRLLGGMQLYVTPITCDGLVEHAAGSDHDAGSGEARASYAGALLRRGIGVPWPPRGNDECWCRSGQNYKTCCGPVPPAEYPEGA